MGLFDGAVEARSGVEIGIGQPGWRVAVTGSVVAVVSPSRNPG